MVALFAVALSELARLAPDNVDVAGPVFGACATFAALFLPAAGLVNQYATIRLPDLAKDLVLHKTDQSHVVAVNKIVARVLGAVRGLPVCFVMFVVALAFATFALFHPDLVLLHWRYAILQVSLENILIGLASTLDLAAACKLLPLAFVLLDRANLQAVYDAAVGLQSVKAEEEEEEEKKEEEEAKKQTPSAQPQAGSPQCRLKERDHRRRTGSWFASGHASFVTVCDHCGGWPDVPPCPAGSQCHGL